MNAPAGPTCTAARGAGGIARARSQGAGVLGLGCQSGLLRSSTGARREERRGRFRSIRNRRLGSGSHNIARTPGVHMNPYGLSDLGKIRLRPSSPAICVHFPGGPNEAGGGRPRTSPAAGRSPPWPRPTFRGQIRPHPAAGFTPPRHLGFPPDRPVGLGRWRVPNQRRELAWNSRRQASSARARAGRASRRKVVFSLCIAKFFGEPCGQSRRLRQQ